MNRDRYINAIIIFKQDKSAKIQFNVYFIEIRFNLYKIKY